MPTSSTDFKTKPVKDRCSEEEWQIRVDLAAAYRLVAHFGWDDLIFTHLSARVPGPEHHFLINPFGLLFEEITASNLVKIDMDAKIVEPSGFIVNAAGFTIHSAIHAAREDANCVLHLHTVHGNAVACQEQGLLPINQTSMVLNGQIAYHEYEGIAFNHDERPRLVKDLGTKNAMILRNHGTLAVGRTVGEAFMTMYFLERSCAMQIAALSGGSKLHYPQDAVQQVVEAQARAEMQSTDGKLMIDKLFWPALLRLLDRKHPGYRD
jgi:ribulose-5-phosphate 4-epimerase/fuculose-1-phosphate aldolase